MIHVGFTGTQRGMTDAQALLVEQFFLQVEGPFAVYHGGCVGADEQFHKIALSFLGCEQIEIYPSNIHDKHGYCPLRSWDRRHPEYPPLSRNRLIVACADVLLATPKERQMVVRSGTWTTVRLAQKAQKQLRIILPDGTWTTAP